MNIEKTDINSCKRYIPITEDNFRVILMMTMSDKAYASYSIGMSELIILHGLKNDFEDYYKANIIGEHFNNALDRGKSCKEAYNEAYLLSENSLNSLFHNFTLSAMAEGQKMMLNNPAKKTDAMKIINQMPIDAIKNTDVREKKFKEFFVKMKKNKSDKQISK